jgi:hypothetical protein
MYLLGSIESVTAMVAVIHSSLDTTVAGPALRRVVAFRRTRCIKPIFG